MDGRTAEERYLTASRSSNLAVNPDRPCDADKLLAAAYAARGDQRRLLALDVYNVLASTDMRGARSVAERMAGWVKRRSLKERGGEIIPRVKAIDIALRLLKVWHKRTCIECGGRGHPLLNDTPVLDETRNCGACHGTGILPLERFFRHEHVAVVRQLEYEVNAMCAMVFDDMRQMLSGRKALT